MSNKNVDIIIIGSGMAGLYSAYNIKKTSPNTSFLVLEKYKKALKDSRIFSHFDNTFPHVKIFARAFSKSKAARIVRAPVASTPGCNDWNVTSDPIPFCGRTSLSTV